MIPMATGFLAFAVAAIWAAQVLPAEVSSVLAAWILSSVPISVLIGHCALSED
jgi:hypothetical protein